MDHMDWMDDEYARELSAALARQMPTGGRVIWRSAALEPPYASIIAAAGFEVRIDTMFLTIPSLLNVVSGILVGESCLYLLTCRFS